MNIRLENKKDSNNNNNHNNYNAPLLSIVLVVVVVEEEEEEEEKGEGIRVGGWGKNWDTADFSEMKLSSQVHSS